jgi:hypothetical protein
VLYDIEKAKIEKNFSNEEKLNVIKSRCDVAGKGANHKKGDNVNDESIVLPCVEQKFDNDVFKNIYSMKVVNVIDDANENCYVNEVCKVDFKLIDRVINVFNSENKVSRPNKNTGKEEKEIGNFKNDNVYSICFDLMLI